METWSRRQLLDFAAAVGTAVAIGGSRAVAQGTGSSDTLGFKTAVELARMIREKTISSVELTRYFIARIERLDSAINAVVVRDFDRALASAAAADNALARGVVVGPLHGLPMTIKEQYDVAGLATTWGIPSREGAIADSDATVVRRLKAAGALLMGKTNVPLNLGDWQSYNDLYGTTNNPWNLERTPGGSSGGAAAALAAGMTALESGGDAAGSIRVPAHFCGVYGHKPTWGIVPDRGATRGMVASADLAVVGPMARSAEDLALAVDVVAGPDELHAPGWRLELPAPRGGSLAGLRVAVWPSDEVSPVATEIATRVQEIADRLALAGATVSDSARPGFSPTDAYRTFTYLGASASGLFVPDDIFTQSQARAASFQSDDMSSAAINARAIVLDHRAWLAHHEARTRLREQWKAFFEDWDIVLCPAARTTAYAHDHRPEAERTLIVDDVETPYRDFFWFGLATVAHLPSTVFPTGPAADGLPIGLQAIGAEFADRTTIEFARLMAQEIGGFRSPPGYGEVEAARQARSRNALSD